MSNLKAPKIINVARQVTVLGEEIALVTIHCLPSDVAYVDAMCAARRAELEKESERALAELAAQAQELGLYDPPPEGDGMCCSPNFDPERDDDEGESAPLPVPAYGGR